MAVNLIIDGQQFELAGAATEETLYRLVEKIDKMSPGSSESLPFKSARKEVENYSNETKKTTVQLKGLSKSADDLASELDDAADAAKSFGGRALDLFSKFGDAVSGVVKFGASTAGVGLSMKQVGDEFTSLLNEVPVLGTALGALGGAMIGHSQNLIDTFGGLSASGAMFTNNLFDLERVAASSYLSLDQMVGIMRENSEAFAVFGGSARLGAQRFALLNQAMQQTYRRDLAMLGMTSQDTAEMLASYTAMQARNTQFATMGVQQQTLAAVNFSKEMQLLANLTGQDRKQLAAKLAQDKRRADVELAMSRMNGEAQGRARVAFQQLEAQFGADSPVIDALRTSFLGLPAASSTAANMLLQDNTLGAAIQDIATGLRNGDPSVTVASISEQLAKSSSGFIEANRGLESIAQYNDYAMEMTTVAASLLNAQKTRLTVEEEFGGNYQAFFEAQRVTLDDTSKGLIDAKLAVEDIGKTLRTAFNELSEASVSSMVTGINSLKTALGGDFVTGLSSYQTELAGATGATKGLANALATSTEKLVTWSNNLKAPALDAVEQGSDDALKSVLKATGAGAAASGSNMLSSFAKSLPVIGALASGGITYATSEQDTEVGRLAEASGSGLGSLGGAAAGAAAGAALGSIIPVLGTTVGGIVGGILGGIGGDILGSKAGGGLADWLGFAEGGIVRQPTLAMIGEGQNDEAVIPLQNNRTVPVDIDMSGVNRLAENVERLVSNQSKSNYSDEMLVELKKFNRHADQMVKKLS